MKNITLGKANFIIDHVLSAYIFWTVYKSYLFKCLPGFSLSVSVIILMGLVFLCCCIGILQNKRPRSYHRLALDVIAAFGLYSIPVYVSVIPQVFIIAAGVAVVCSIAYIIMTARLKIANRSKVTRKKILIYKANKDLGGVASIICICLVVIMLIIGVYSFLGKPLADPLIISKQSIIVEQTIENNINILVKLVDETRATLTTQQVRNVLQTVVDIEQWRLGLPTKLTVVVGQLERPVVGSYSDSKHEITIDKDYLQNATAEKLINTICHEAFHSLQHRMVDVYEQTDQKFKKLLFFNEAISYKREFEDYISSRENMDEYQSQLCEENASKYAKIETEVYLKKIYDYIQYGPGSLGQ